MSPRQINAPSTLPPSAATPRRSERGKPCLRLGVVHEDQLAAGDRRPHTRGLRAGDHHHWACGRRQRGIHRARDHRRSRDLEQQLVPAAHAAREAGGEHYGADANVRRPGLPAGLAWVRARRASPRAGRRRPSSGGPARSRQGRRAGARGPGRPRSARASARSRAARRPGSRRHARASAGCPGRPACRGARRHRPPARPRAGSRRGGRRWRRRRGSGSARSRRRSSEAIASATAASSCAQRISCSARPPSRARRVRCVSAARSITEAATPGNCVRMRPADAARNGATLTGGSAPRAAAVQASSTAERTANGMIFTVIASVARLDPRERLERGHRHRLVDRVDAVDRARGRPAGGRALPRTGCSVR